MEQFYSDTKVVIADDFRRQEFNPGEFDTVHYRWLGSIGVCDTLDRVFSLLKAEGKFQVYRFAFTRGNKKLISPGNAWAFWTVILNQAQESDECASGFETRLQQAGFSITTQREELPLGSWKSGYEEIGSTLLGITVAKIKGICTRILENSGMNETTAAQWVRSLEEQLWEESKMGLTIER